MNYSEWTRLPGKVFLSNYEKFMTAHFQDPTTEKQRHYREVLKEKMIGLERIVLDRAEKSGIPGTAANGR